MRGRLSVGGRGGGLGGLVPYADPDMAGVAGAGQVGAFGGGASFNAVPGRAPSLPSDDVRRGVVAASAGAVAQASLSPSLYEALFAQADGQGGSAHGVAEQSENVYPLGLSSPDVFKRPDTLGDGGNQYVYDSQQPDGELVVPAVVTVQGGNQDNATFATSHVDWALSPAIPNQVLPYVKYPYGSQVFAETPINSTTVTTGFVFRGLPERYNDFGNRTVIMTVDGSNSEVAHTQIFFGEKDLNWPNTDYIVDNWYHYYDQVYTSPGEYEATSGPSYTQSYVDGLGFRGSEIHITDQAAGEWVVRVFGLKDSLSPYVIFLGTIETKGVHNYIETCAHEHGHADAWVSSTSADGFIEQSTTSDGDLVVTSYEDTHHLKSNTKDTTEAYAGLEPGDTEVLADIPALQPMLNHIANWHDDWSDAGLQYGTLYFSSPSGPPDFYWKFTPNTTTSVHMTPTGSPDSSGYYHIKNLEDIGNLYPGATILTTLRQLDPPS